MMGGSLLTVAMIVMMGGMVAGAGWAIMRRRTRKGETDGADHH